jgi:hypothetical protein
MEGAPVVERRWEEEFITPLALAAHEAPVGSPGAILTEAQMRGTLRAAIDAMGSQKAWADAHGVSQQHLSDILRERRGVSEHVANRLGFRLLRMFAPLEDEED